MDVFKKFLEVEQKADDVGFSWQTSEQILEQIKSECAEIQDVLDKKESKERLTSEIGDLLHAVSELALFHGIQPEDALLHTTIKVEKRLEVVYRLAKEEGYENLKNQPFELFVRLWKKAKTEAG